ncbi:hypothetical protein NQZ68_001788 [Dissostichus eleginoides]|nr:hypothetical protein NQZ68_001788 [Dissostichus eleginoides]
MIAEFLSLIFQRNLPVKLGADEEAPSLVSDSSEFIRHTQCTHRSHTIEGIFLLFLLKDTKSPTGLILGNNLSLVSGVKVKHHLTSETPTGTHQSRLPHPITPAWAFRRFHPSIP